MIDAGRPPPGNFFQPRACRMFVLRVFARRAAAVINCGAPDANRAAAREAARMTAAHSTLVIDDTSSCRFASHAGLAKMARRSDRRGSGQGRCRAHRPAIGNNGGCSRIMAMRRDSASIHERRILLSKDGKTLDGSRSFRAAKAGEPVEKRPFARALPHSSECAPEAGSRRPRRALHFAERRNAGSSKRQAARRTSRKAFFSRRRTGRAVAPRSRSTEKPDPTRLSNGVSAILNERRRARRHKRAALSDDPPLARRPPLRWTQRVHRAAELPCILVSWFAATCMPRTGSFNAAHFRARRGGATAAPLFQRHSRINDPALARARRPVSRCAFHRCHA